ncbi:hypothetical protein [Methanolapillus millepedarum]|uniref:Uncharacterized protein n=1 Tax=Methanolapillus millepedarum TaxID=3028296 RepID=A0AA96V2Y7_9EURY|nr:hypothetical protein MsAc7_04840 [Methanosarcinaceae archaeon Ac7]
MIGLKEMAFAFVGTAILSAVIFAWYAFGTDFFNFDYTSNTQQFIATFVGVAICLVTYVIAKPQS